MQANTSYAGYTWLGIGLGIMQIYGEAPSVSICSVQSAVHTMERSLVSMHMLEVQYIFAVQTMPLSMEKRLLSRLLLEVQNVLAVQTGLLMSMQGWEQGCSSHTDTPSRARHKHHPKCNIQLGYLSQHTARVPLTKVTFKQTPAKLSVQYQEGKYT